MSSQNKNLPRAKFPEEVGVKGSVLKDFTVFAEENNLEMHSLMVVRHGKVALEWYNEPFNAETPHAMYSISKSITSTAIGYAVAEGLIALDDVVVDFFPEYPPKKESPYFQELTVRHLLTMTSGKQTDMLVPKGKIDWIENYINAPWIFEPGTDFLYVNENIYMLCAILHKVTKMTVIEYLTPRLFEPLGIETPFWETDQNGIEAGGWGLQLTTEDLAKIADCYLHDGKYKRKQVIPKMWVEEATKNQLGEIKQRSLDLGYNSGYGYCFWANDTEDYSYRMDGMFSQFAINFPSYDATVVLTAAVAVEKKARMALWEFFPKAFIEESKVKTKVPETDHELGIVPVSNHSPMEKVIEGRTIKMRRKILLNIVGLPVSMLPAAVTFMMADRAGNMDNISFHFGEHECEIRWDENKKEHNAVACGMDGHYRYGTMTLGGVKFKVCANAYWLSENVLKLSVRPLESIGMRGLRFKFKSHNRVSMKPSSTPTTAEIGESLSGSFTEILDNPVIAKAAQFLIQFAPFIADATHHGRFID